MRLVQTGAALLAVAATATVALADDIQVPQDVRNLKDALLTAQPGDRVIVTGGVWRNGRVLSAITMIGRSGATLSGTWEVQGAGATVQGFTVRDGSIEIKADGVTLRQNRFVPPGGRTKVSADAVNGLALLDNRFTRSRAEIGHATDCVVRGNRILSGSVSVYGSGTLAEDNVALGRATISAGGGANAVIRRNTGGFLDLQGTTNAVVDANTVQAIDVRGNGAHVTDNELPAGRGLVVVGDDAVVRGNRVSIVVPSGGLTVVGDRAVVTDNVVDNLRANRRNRGTSGLLSIGGVYSVRGAGPSQVLRNTVTHRLLGGLEVNCDDAEVASNTVRGTGAARSLWLLGNRNNVHDNTFTRQSEFVVDLSGIYVAGDENVVADVTLDQAPYDGVFVSGSDNLLARVHVGRAGRCGITVDEDAAGTGVADCVVEKASWASLFVLGTDTTVTGGSFTGGRKVDVLDLGTGTEFVSTTYETKSESEGLRPYR